MNFTELFCKVVGPVLLVRALSILIDRQHFIGMIRGLKNEISTVSFSFFPIALLMACTAIAVTHTDRSTPAAWLIHLIAWGGIAKATVLMLFPQLVVTKAQQLEKAGFLNVVLVTCFVIGGYFSWFGYFTTGGS